MSREACVEFLKWWLPRLGLRWQGYRKVHRLVCKRLNKRLAELGLAELSQYTAFLEAHPDEWVCIQTMCRIPISRFYRDRDVFPAIAATVIPAAAATAVRSGQKHISCWSAGCAAGEEPYTLLLVWHYLVAHAWPLLDLDVIATDADEVAIHRARAACYGPSSLRDLPQAWLEAFHRVGNLLYLNRSFRDRVDFQLQDITRTMPVGPFEIILCRNLVFTYFDMIQWHRLLTGILDRLSPGGFLVLGKHETLPTGSSGIVRVGKLNRPGFAGGRFV